MQFAHKAAIALATLAALGLTAARPAQAQTYAYTTIDDPLATGNTDNSGNYNGSQATGINDAGQIVGTYVDKNYADDGFLYTPGTCFTTLDDPTVSIYDGTQANGINNAGQIVGSYGDDNGLNHGFVYTAATGFTTLDAPNAADEANANGYNGTFASGINNAGQVVGGYVDNNNNSYGFLDTPGAGPLSFITLNDPAGSTGTFAHGINDSGQVVGNYSTHGFLYTLGTGFTTLDDPQANTFATVVTGINNAGQAVGVYYDDNGVENGFLYTPGTGFTTLDDPAATSGVFSGTRLGGINNAGQIVGSYTDADGVYHGFIASPVPEASTTASFGVLLLMGAGGLLMTARKRAKTTA